MEIKELESPVLVTVEEKSGEVVSTITAFTKDLDQASMKEAVGGWIELVKSKCGKYDVIINEEGRLRHLHHNQIASTLCGHYIVGDVIVVPIGLIE